MGVGKVGAGVAAFLAVCVFASACGFAQVSSDRAMVVADAVRYAKEKMETRLGEVFVTAFCDDKFPDDVISENKGGEASVGGALALRAGLIEETARRRRPGGGPDVCYEVSRQALTLPRMNRREPYGPVFTFALLKADDLSVSDVQQDGPGAWTVNLRFRSVPREPYVAMLEAQGMKLLRPDRATVTVSYSEEFSPAKIREVIRVLGEEGVMPLPWSIKLTCCGGLADGPSEDDNQ